MKNYVIAILGVLVLALSSIIYKIENSPSNVIPVLQKTENPESDPQFFLYLFFSKKDCKSCLDIVQVLNSLPSHFKVAGVIPDNELKYEVEIRTKTGVSFPLLATSRLKKYKAGYTPMMVGATPNGKILLTLPGIAGGKQYLKNLLESLYSKLYLVLLSEKLSRSN